MKPSLEVADIFRQYGEAYRERFAARLSIEQVRAMHAIEVCRTAELGGHVEACDHCEGKRISYNSCRNRHCPKCQGLEKERWRAARQQDLLPIPYFHVVFTLPEELASLALRNQEIVYAVLFRAASQSLLELGRDRKYLGGQIGCCPMNRTAFVIQGDSVIDFVVQPETRESIWQMGTPIVGYYHGPGGGGGRWGPFTPGMAQKVVDGGFTLAWGTTVEDLDVVWSGT